MSSVPMEREEEGPSATCQYRPEAKDVSRVIELYLHSFLKSCNFHVFCDSARCDRAAIYPMSSTQKRSGISSSGPG